MANLVVTFGAISQKIFKTYTTAAAKENRRQEAWERRVDHSATVRRLIEHDKDLYEKTALNFLESGISCDPGTLAKVVQEEKPVDWIEELEKQPKVTFADQWLPHIRLDSSWWYRW